MSLELLSPFVLRSVEPAREVFVGKRVVGTYCPRCQTGGKLLADRGLSRLLEKDWPRSIEELEAYKAARRR